jgi:CRISPR/Cas system-associated exonuclease Cas4 (RecB family)
VERDVELKIDNNLVLRGVVDLIEFKDGTYFIADHKTSKIKHYNTSTLPIPQLLLYYLALKQSGVILDNMNFKLRFDVIRKLKIKGDIQSFEIPDEYLDAEYINELMNMVKGVARAMKENIVYRFKSWTCKGCQYATQCESLKLSQLIDVQAEDTIPEPVPCVATIITAAA